jgi:hypothetical protein
MESRYLEARDLGPGETVAEIEGVERFTLGTVVRFRGIPKPLLLRDGAILAELGRAFLDHDVSRWSGRSVVLTPIASEVSVRADIRPARLAPERLKIKGEGPSRMMI